MKKLLTGILAVCAFTVCAYADYLTKTSIGSYVGLLANETGLTYSNTYVLDLSVYNAARVSAQVDYTSATFAASTFTDGSKSTGSVTVVSTTGLSGVILKINQIPIVAGTDYVIDVPTQTATNLAALINSMPDLSAFITAHADSSVVTSTSVSVGGNYPMTTSDATKLSVSHANMTGGVSAGYNAADDRIIIPAHGFPLGLAVAYSTGSASGTIGGLTAGTVYYVIPVDVNTIRLSTTSARAIAGLYINLTGQNASTTAYTYTLTPSAISGTPGFYWQVSNDGVDYSSFISGSSETISGYTAPYATAFYDFSNVNYRYLRLNVAGPTTGGILLKATVNVKE
jgi:hypothetical protein